MLSCSHEAVSKLPQFAVDGAKSVLQDVQNVEKECQAAIKHNKGFQHTMQDVNGLVTRPPKTSFFVSVFSAFRYVFVSVSVHAQRLKWLICYEIALLRD